MANPPNDLIYDFKGYFESKDGSSLISKKRSSSKADKVDGKEEDLLVKANGAGNEDLDMSDSRREPLSLENTMWANTVLASSGHILGMIVYTGVETRA